jgi:hypothetical protein
MQQHEQDKQDLKRYEADKYGGFSHQTDITPMLIPVFSEPQE